MKYYNFISNAEVWHEVDKDGIIWTVTQWSNGHRASWDNNGIVSFDGSLEFELIYNVIDN